VLALESLSCRRNTAFSQATTVVLGRHPNDDADAICHPPIGNYPTRTSHQLSRQALGGKITERILAILESRLELFPPVLLLQALTKESSSLAFCCSPTVLHNHCVPHTERASGSSFRKIRFQTNQSTSRHAMADPCRDSGGVLFGGASSDNVDRNWIVPIHPQNAAR